MKRKSISDWLEAYFIHFIHNKFGSAMAKIADPRAPEDREPRLTKGTFVFKPKLSPNAAGAGGNDPGKTKPGDIVFEDKYVEAQLGASLQISKYSSTGRLDSR